MLFGTARRRHGRPAARSLALAACLFLFSTAPARAALFTVTNNADSGAGSLRQAILGANATQIADVIQFNLPANQRTITPITGLPVLTAPVEIDGTTQPGYAGTPIVEIDGTNIASYGIQIAATNCGLKGLVINRFQDQAVVFWGPGSSRLQVSYVGTDPSGTQARPNGTGVYVSTGSNLNLIAGNLISGNTGFGIQVEDGANQNSILGNRIGTNAAGTSALGNGSYAVYITGDGNHVGSAVAGLGNLISGNGRAIDLVGANNVVAGNTIGLNAAGNAKLPNHSSGVEVYGDGNTVGGTAQGAGNVLSGNDYEGISLGGGATLNTIQGNLIGTNAASATGLGNGIGIRILDATGNTIGGTTLGARNVISGHDGGAGIYMDPEAVDNSIEGNYIGTNAAGTGAVPNLSGIRVFGTGNTIGGTAPAARNVISGNYFGIEVEVGSLDNLVVGNYVGTNASGTGAVANTSGIVVFSSGNTIGGTAPGAGNLVSGNGTYGIVLRMEDSPADTVVQGNKIGTQANGVSPLGNGQVGIRLIGGIDNLIGGTDPGAGNTIAYNGWYGVFLESGNGNRLLGNSMFGNGFGIDIAPYGVTPNDPGDVDFGPNHTQNYPILSSVLVAGGTTTVQGVLDSTPSTQFRIEFFSNPACNPAGAGDGRTFLGSTNVITNANGHGVISTVLPVGTADPVVTATATSASGDTSEFSPCAPTDGPHPGVFQFTQQQYVTNESTVSGKITVIRTMGSTGPVSVHYATTNGSAIAPDDYTPVSGTLDFADGEAVKTFEIPVVLDSVPDGQEELGLTLSSPTGGATLGAWATSKLIITAYSDTYPTAWVSDATVVEGDNGAVNAVFTITLTPASLPVDVHYSTFDATAVAGVDYDPVTGVLHFQPGDAPKQVVVPVHGDSLAEDNESFYLSLTGVYNGTVTDFSGEGIIMDDDAQPDVACAGGTTIARPKIVISGLGGAPGDERITFKGGLLFPAGTPAGYSPLDSVGHGAQVLVEDLGSGGSAIYDLSHSNSSVPPGALAASCAPNKLDGWIANQTLTAYTYNNKSGAFVSAGCAPGSANGLKKLSLRDRRASKGTIEFRASVGRTSVPTPVGPLRGTVVLAADAAASAMGHCGSHSFDALDCTLNGAGTKLTCK